MKSFLFALFIIFALQQFSFSQPAFTSFGEIKVSQSPADDSPPSIAVNKDGAAWVVWNNAVQWFYPDLNFNGANNKTIKYALLPLSIPDGKWCVYLPRFSCSDGLYVGCTLNYRLFTFDEKGIIDSTKVLFTESSYDYSRQEPGEYSWQRITDAQISISNHSSVTSIEFLSDMVSSGTRGTFRNNLMLIHDMHDLTALISDEKTENWYAEIRVPKFKLYGIPNRIISVIRDNKFLQYARLQKVYGFPLVDKTTYLIYVTLFDLNGNKLLPDVLIDSLSPNATDLSEQILLGSKNDFYLFKRRILSDTIIFQHFSIKGDRNEPERFFLSRVRTYPGIRGLHDGNGPIVDSAECFKRIELNIHHLSNGGYISICTKVESDSSTNVYAGLLDENMNWLAQPKRINSEADGNQYSPSIAVKGDTVYVTWLDTRNGERHVYMRRFTADQITDVNYGESQPTQFAIQEIYPNPFHESTTIRFSLSQNWERVGVRVYDLLGRELRTLVNDEVESGTHTVQFNANGLPNGVYQVVLQSGNQVQRKKIVLMK